MPEVAGTLIVGGGIAGLALAGVLHRRGMACEVVERSATWPAIGAGIDVLPALLPRRSPGVVACTT